jgi:hypothetical protein
MWEDLGLPLHVLQLVEAGLQHQIVQQQQQQQ